MAVSRSLGNLIVRLVAEGLGGYKADMNAAADVTKDAANKIEAATSKVGEATKKLTQDQAGAADESKKLAKELEQARFSGEKMGQSIRYGAIAAVGGVIAAQYAVEKLIGSVARYQDLAEQTGGDAAGIASLRTAADVGGVSVDSLSLAANRLQTNLAKVDDESKGVGKALAAIGVEVQAFKQLRPDEQMRALGVALNQYADSGEKTAVIQDTLGRGSADMLSALKELGNEQQQNNYLTNEQIALADDYKDAQARMKSELLQSAESIATQMLPALTALTGATKDVIGELLGVGSGASDLERNKAIQEWSKSGAEGVAFLADAMLALVNIAKFVVADVKLTFANLKVATDISFTPGGIARDMFDDTRKKEIAQGLKEERDAQKAHQEALNNLMSNGSKFRDALAKQFSEADRKSSVGKYEGIPGGGKASISYNAAAGKSGGGGGPSGPSKEDRDYERAVKGANDYIAKLKEEALESGATAEQVKMLKAAREAAKAPTAELKMYIMAQALETEQARDAARVEKELAKSKLDTINANATLAEGIQSQTASVQDQIKAERQHTEEMGLGKTALQALEVARINDTAASFEHRAATLAEASPEIAQGYRDQAAALRGLAVAKGESASKSVAVDAQKLAADAAKKYQDDQVKIWSEIDDKAESVFMDIAKNGTSAFKSLEEELKNGLLKMLYEMTVKPFIIKIGTEITGMDNLGSLMGGGSGGNPLSSLGGAAMQMLTGGSVGASSASLMGANAVGAMGGDSLGALIGMNGGWAGVAGPAVEGLAALAPAIGTIGATATAAAAPAVAAGAGIGGMAAAALAAVPVIGWVALGAAALFAIFSSGGDKIPNVTNDLALFNNSLVGLPFLELAIGSDEVAQGLRDVLYGLENASPTMRKLAGETLNLSVELMRSAGDIVGARNLARNLGTRGMSEEEVGLFDKNQAMRDQIAANNAASAAASAGAAAAREAEQAENALAQTRYALAGRLNVLLGRQTQLQFDRATELAGATDAAVIAMLNEIYKIEDLTTARDNSFAVLERSIAKEKELATTRLKGATDLVAALKTAKDAISPSLSTATARSQLAMFVALAKSAGILPSAEAIKPTLDSLSKVATDDYKTANEYYRDQAITANDISELAGYAGEQVSAEQQTIDRLDLQLDTAKQALDVLKGIDNSIVSVAAADAAFYAAMVSLTAAQAGAASYSYAAPAAVASSYGGGGGYAGGGASSASSAASATAGMDSDMVAAFQAYYGRNPDQAGYDNFAKSGLTGDAMMQAILRASIADRAGADYAYAVAHGFDPENPASNFYHGKNKYKASTATAVEDYGSFADGGDHGGGFRLVGERGPELEATGPSRITNTESLMALLKGGGGGNSETNALMQRLVASNERLEKKVADLMIAADKTAQNTGNTDKSLRNMTNDGVSLNVKTVA